MTKRVTLSIPTKPLTWDPTTKETWHLEFENKLINDERWNCSVSAMVQAKAQDEEGIQAFKESVASGLRRAIKVITMADVIKLLKGNDIINEGKKMDNEKNSKIEKSDKKIKNIKTDKEQNKSKTEIKEKKENKKTLEFSMTQTFPIVKLAKQYAIFTETECILPPDLMAGVLKYLIIYLKEENIFWKKVQMVKERKIKEKKIKANFIKSQMPFVISSFYSEPTMEPTMEKSSKEKEFLKDEPVGGPDLYIVLTEFYNPYYFTHLLKINVPFVALFRIRNFKEIGLQKLSTGSISGKTESILGKKALVIDFWKKLVNDISIAEYNSEFKNFLLLEYQLPFLKSMESKNRMCEVIFDEFSWMLYYTYHLNRQHKSFLQELFVQRIVKSLEPLELSKCNVYNKLCDILVTGLSNTIYLIVYAIIEQIVAGIPHTQFVYEEYQPEFCDIFSNASEPDVLPGDIYKDSKGKNYIIVTPCLQCRDKKFIPPGICLRPSLEESEKLTEVPNETTKAIKNFQAEQLSTESLLQKKLEKEEKISETWLDEILSETKKENQENQVQKIPNLCFYGDKFYLHTYQCDPRIIDPKVIMNRFLKQIDITQLWSKFPKISASDKAYYNFHFLRFEEISKITKSILKIKIAFVLSMKLLGISSSYFYKGEEDTKSEMFTLSYREKLKRLSRARFQKRESFFYTKDNKIGFSFVFFKILNPEHYSKTTKKIAPKVSRLERFKSSFLKPASSILKKVTSHFNLYFVAHRISGIHYPYNKSIDSVFSSSFTSKNKDKDKELAALYSLIDCFDISNLSEPFLLNNKEDYVTLMKNFNFYETLEPTQMVQRILKAFNEFNTIQCSHYSLTDNLIVIMYNDYDHRRIFYSYGVSTLLTPLVLRDFYNYLYPEINDWLTEEQEEYEKFVNQIEKKIKALNEIEDQHYLNKLKKKFKAMNEEQKIKFLNMDFVNLVQNNQFEVEIKQEELKDLPIKPKFEYPNKISFIATNFSDVRVETHKKVQEFHSLDGTILSVVVDSWLYDSYSLLTMSIKKSKLKFYYHNWLGKEHFNSMFTLKTSSDIIFVFYKNEISSFYSTTTSGSSSVETKSKSSADTSSKSDYSTNKIWQYLVKVSWPTGLLIQTIPLNDLNFYIKQSYIDVYRKKTSIQNEKARCFLQNGQILLFKENGEVEVFCASGAKYILKDFIRNKKNSEYIFMKDEFVSSIVEFSISQYQHVSSIGEVWEENKKHCHGKKKLTEILKIYIGVDAKTKETFYKRDDGVSCMLWPNGKLVTSFPDGTKITSTPDFDVEEIEIDWSEEERFYFQKLETKSYDEQYNEDYKAKTNIKKLSLDATSQNLTAFRNIQNEKFVSVSLTYLMEHPKYSTVFFDNENNLLELKMPKNVFLKVQPQSKFVIKQGKTDFMVKNNILQFTTNCSSCNRKSLATIILRGKEVLCEFIDFFGNMFKVYRNGETVYKDSQEISDEMSVDPKKEPPKKCNHFIQISEKQKCFVLERDFSGTEFLHNESFARQCSKFPEETYYDLDSTSTKNCVLTHMFSIPYFKVGCDKWEMEYEDKNNAIPTNLKKKDLKELEAKDTIKNRFKYPFPNSQTTPCSHLNTEVTKKKYVIPKFIVTRIIKCLSSDPNSIIDELQKNIAIYQNKALKIYKEYKKRKHVEESSNEEKTNLEIEDRLNQIALNLNQKQGLYSRLYNKLPLNTKDLHYYKHNIELMEKLNEGINHYSKDSTLCKYIQSPLPRLTNFDSIPEETENEFLQDETDEEKFKS